MFYRKGYIVKQDYYNGENYANCLLLQLLHINDKKQIKYNQFEAEKVYRELIDFVSEKEDEDDYWKYATLAVIYYYFDNFEHYNKNKKLFSKRSDKWEEKTFQETIQDIKCVKERFNLTGNNSIL